MDEFWLIFKDDTNKHYEIIGKSDDDTELIEITVRLQDAGHPVRCETPRPSTVRKKLLKVIKALVTPIRKEFIKAI